MFNKITKSTIDGTKSAKDFTIKKWKRFIRKRALKRVEKLMAYISNLKATVGLSSVLLLLGIPKL